MCAGDSLDAVHHLFDPASIVKMSGVEYRALIESIPGDNPDGNADHVRFESGNLCFHLAHVLGKQTVKNLNRVSGVKRGAGK